jgi:predicted TIM-barrel fold metal-dependent hydrolase
VYDADEMRLAKSLWSTSHIVFGSDFPYFSAAETVEGVKNCGVFNQPELQAIYYENLHRLVPRLRTV